MFSKHKEIICYNFNKKGHTAPNFPNNKEDKSKKKFEYRNKKGKINFFDLLSSCDELISSDSESEHDLNFVYSEDTSEDEYCRGPHCT